jgi:polyferredoxin
LQLALESLSSVQLVYYGTPWLTWNDRQAVLFDSPTARKFFILASYSGRKISFYLTVLLLISRRFTVSIYGGSQAALIAAMRAMNPVLYTEMFFMD